MLAAGGTLEDRPVYNKSSCFEPFPFPSEDTGLTPDLTDRIRSLAEQIDAHRKARQAAFDTVTLTGLYNVLDKLRRSEALSPREKVLHEKGLVSVLQSLHDELDAAVLQAYGWSDLGPVPWADDAARAAWTETLLERLVALNARRAAEEAAGTIRWLRPDFQNPSASPIQTTPLKLGSDPGLATATPATKAEKRPWPATLPEQVRAVADALTPTPQDEPSLAAHFTGKGPWKKRLPEILAMLTALGRAKQSGGGWVG